MAPPQEVPLTDSVSGYRFDACFDYENGFYLTAGLQRFSKFLSHYELYRKIEGLPGHILECGVFKGASLMRWAAFRDIIENPFARKIIGFDSFGPFPETAFEPDQLPRRRFIAEAGSRSLSADELRLALERKGHRNIELVPGDIVATSHEYVRSHPELKIALLHVDTDIYEPAKAAVSAFYPRIVRGGLLVVDDYGTFPGETRAVDEYFSDTPIEIKKLSVSHHIPAYVVKQ
jgi:hypothetical protein